MSRRIRFGGAHGLLRPNPPVVLTDSCVQNPRFGGHHIPEGKAIRFIGLFAAQSMATKIKGLLKGLRYISQIFDMGNKEQEMQIGYPTDVKHVAHIGWEGPVSTPSWMKEFATVPNFSSAPLALTVAAKEPIDLASASKDLHGITEAQDSPVRSSPRSPNGRRRHKLSSDSSSESPSKDSTDLMKPAKRHLLVDNPSGQELSNSLNKPSRHHKTQGSLALDSPSRDSHKIPRQSRPRRPKGSSNGSPGSTSRSSKSKASSGLTNEELTKPYVENHLEAVKGTC